MQTRRERRKRQPPGKSSSREFYYVGPPSTFQTRRGLESVHTRGPLRNIQCEELDEKPSCNARGKLLWGVVFAGNTSENYISSG